MLGLLMGRWRLFMELIDPMVELLRFLSPTAMITIALMFFYPDAGVTSAAQIIVIGLLGLVIFTALLNLFKPARARPK